MKTQAQHNRRHRRVKGERMNGIIRVFPRRSKQYTPVDDYAFISHPLFNELDGQIEHKKYRSLPEHKEVHISCAFTWDKAACLRLQELWQKDTNKPVKLGGPAFGSPVDDFVQGMYIKRNIIFTSRGCNNNCPWCGVPKFEGMLRELPVLQGNWIQDNNFLQCSRPHKDKVFEMLKTQSGICFKGGLEVDLIDDHFISAITSLRISELWLACDTDARLPEFKKACQKLVKAGFSRDKIRCYVLSYGRNMDKDEARARAVYEAGAMPSMQLYRDFTDDKTTYSKDWEAFARMWQRPAIMKAHMEKGTDFHDFNK